MNMITNKGMKCIQYLDGKKKEQISEKSAFNIN